ncbi:LptA/OstA family protein [Deinococcus lacus]|uniref:LptA/OstA family protein n=1 Tax=Deinococcus lacus TaxID=392561 RepID=A0ABW1YCQ5_9DEIO
MFKKRMTLILALAAGTVLAQTAQNRIVKIQGAPRGDVKNGPLTFTGNPVRATVSSLSITAKEARLAAPAGQTMAAAQGKRNARFMGDVKVTRGRLTAQGNELAYNEASGQGVLSGNARASFVPDDKSNGDTVSITAAKMSLDVDSNVSTSTGSVKLVNGNQSGRAETLVFDEDRELARLTGSPTLTRTATGKQKELVITGKEARALTKNKTLYVTGGVKLVQGSIVTTGNSLYYDDNKNVAYVVGNAVSKDSKTGTTFKAPAKGALEQRTDLARVRTLSTAFNIPTAQFKMRGE